MTFKHFLADTWQKIVRTFRMFFAYLMSQVGMQVMNFASGLLLIRAMAKDQYAAYTIMNTLVPVMLVLSDTGISSGVMAIGRHHFQDNEKMGRLVSTALQMRRKFALYSFAIIGPFLAWMLFRNSVDVWTIALLTIASLAGISSQLMSAVLKAVLGLRQQFPPLMRMGLASTLLRLALIAGLIFLFTEISAFTAILAGTCSIFLETFIALRATKPQIVWNAPPDPEYKKEIFSLVWRTLPFTIYYCIQGQLSIWLISIFGHGEQVADLGAATRLAIIFTTVCTTFAALLINKFAIANGRRRLLLQFFQIAAGLVVILTSVVMFSYIYPAPFVWLLGDKYINMSPLIWLVILCSGVGQISGVMFMLNTSKGWIPPAKFSIPLELSVQIALLCFLNLTTIHGVLIFSGLAAIPPLCFNSTILVMRILKEPEDGAPPAAIPATT